MSTSETPWLGLCAALAVVAGCGDEPAARDRPVDAGPDAVVSGCRSDRTCPGESVCASGPVHEIAFEEGERGECALPGELIGGAPGTWAWRSGGRPLGARLCTAQGLSSGTSATADALRARQRMLLEGLGTSVIRLDLTWSRIEPRPGELDFSAHDPMIDAAVAAGLDVVGILAYGVPWASSLTDDDDKFPPDDPTDYGRYAGAVAAHYAGRIRRYELWNEPNGGYRFFLPDLHGDAAHYAELVVAAAAAVRAECADCEIFAGGLFFHEQLINGAVEFIHDMLTARPDALDSVDALSFHPYPLYPPSAPPEQETGGERALGGMVADIRAVLGLHGVGALPLGMTELGWPSYPPVDEATQAMYLARAVLLAVSLGVDPICWFNVVDGSSHGTFPPEDDFGLYRHGSADPASPIDPKPAATALAWLAHIGAGAVPAGPVDDAELHDPDRGRFALTFDAPSGSWMALWCTEGAQEITLGGETRSAYDVSGALVAEPSAIDLVFTVGPSPVYLRAPE